MSRNIVPRANKDADLGTQSKNWNKLYVDAIALQGEELKPIVDGKVDKTILQDKGDLYTATAPGEVVRLPRGADGFFLTVNSSNPEGLEWKPGDTTVTITSVYERGTAPSIKGTLAGADRHTIVSPGGGLIVGIDDMVYKLPTEIELDLNNAECWDTITPNYTVAGARAGKDFYIYVCKPSSGYVPILILSANSTYPVGYTANTSRKIGGFHCLCASVGTISGHPLSGFVTGDILPLSVWDLLHRPKTASPEGMVWCPSANIWVDIYLQSGTGSTTASAYGATITDTRTWMDHVDDLGAVGKRLLDDAEFQLIAAGGNEKTNIQGSADPGTTGGHVDTAGRRMISSIGCEDCAGVIWQWLSDQSYRYASTTSFGWYDLPGGKGDIYIQGSTADVKLRAGGRWDSGADCGSRCRDAYGYRWDASASCGARGAAEPM